MIKICLLFLALILSACDSSTPVYDKLSDEAVILAFGDSLTYGTGASENDDYPTI
jgi:lysophospholipase L1-like esterase